MEEDELDVGTNLKEKKRPTLRDTFRVMVPFTLKGEDSKKTFSVRECICGKIWVRKSGRPSVLKQT